MHQDSNEEIFSWQNLTEKIEQRIAPFREFLSEEEILDDGLFKRLLWLIPIVQLMQENPLVQRLRPFVHHAVLELNCAPRNVRQYEYLEIYALQSDLYRLTQYSRQSDANKWEFHIVGEGDSSYIILQSEHFALRHL